jgi:tRNA-uridine 2-sulfurtransferase
VTRRRCPEAPADPLDLLPVGAVVAVAMSGGVDSSVAAARCVARGLDCIGITLAMWPRNRSVERDRGCCGVDATTDARRVASRLGIRHYAWDMEELFAAEVIGDFENEHLAGRTPNPCVRCNQRIKFGALLERARAVGATYVATGHYARLGRRGGSITLHRGADPAKDQAYTLYRLAQDQLVHAVFPVGGLPSKDAVRAEAVRLGLAVAAKPDSQELCFVDGSIGEELSRRLAGRFAPGPIVDTDGGVLGEHLGLPFYTVGQRSGLGLRPRQPDAGPRYVMALDASSNTVVVGTRRELGRRRVRADRCAWVSGEPPAAGRQCQVQLRAHGTAHEALIVSATPAAVEVHLAEPAAQVAPGQSLVLYDGDEVLGGGIIAEAA